MEEKGGKSMEKPVIVRNTGGGGNEPQGRQGKPPIESMLELQPILTPCHPELTFSLAERKSKQKESKTEGLSKQLCHPELVSGSWHRYIIPTKEKTNNIPSAFHTAKRRVSGDYIPRKAAFTLAEVLITLGIIGVVAAMTLPTLIQNYQAKQRVTQLKKVSSVLNQAYLRVKEKYGSVETWGLTSTVTGEVDEDGNEIKDYTSASLFAARLAEFLNKSTFVKANESIGNVRTLDGRKAFYPWIPNAERYIKLADGTIIGVGWILNNCNSATKICTGVWIAFPKKQDMRIGVDVFQFDFIPLKGFLPNGWNQMSGPLAGKCSAKSSSLPPAEADRACTAWALYNENMDYLKCDDLNWQTKKTCK